MRILLTFIIAFTVNAYGQITHLIFQVDGTVVQGVPARNVDNIKEGLHVKAGRRNYALFKGMEKLLFALQTEGKVIIHFYNDEPSHGTTILKAIPFGGSLKMDVLLSDQVSKMFGPSDLVNGMFDIKKLSFDNRVVFISSRDQDKYLVPEENFLKVGEEIFYFEDYTEASNEEISFRSNGLSDVADKFFTTQPLWEETMSKAEILYSHLIPSIKSTDFTGALKAEKLKGSSHHKTFGSRMAQYDFLRYRLELRVDENELKGCNQIDNLDNTVYRQISLNRCNSLMDIAIEYDLSPGQATCNFSTGGGQKVEGIGLESCMELGQYKTRARYDQKVCSAFTFSNEYLTDLALSECDLKEVYVIDPEGSYHFGGFNQSFISMTQEEAVEVLRDKPTADDIFKLWYPYDVNESIGFAWRDCRDPSAGYHPIKERNGVLAEECEGDTFYSWGPQAKLDNLKSWMGQDDWVDEFRALFMARTPIGSFGYGPIAVRIKVKDDIVWTRSSLAHSSCDSLSLAEKQYKIVYRAMAIFGSYLLDIILCSPGPIHSWSYGTKEHYDEIIKDYWWTVKGKRWEDIYEVYINNIDALFGLYSIDGKDFRNSTLEANIKKHFETANTYGGEIFFNPDVLNKKRSDHFETSYPIYFNER